MKKREHICNDMKNINWVIGLKIKRTRRAHWEARLIKVGTKQETKPYTGMRNDEKGISRPSTTDDMELFERKLSKNM